jgi:hypothetical protein
MNAVVRSDWEQGPEEAAVVVKSFDPTLKDMGETEPDS